jgi:hypothetical protein
MPIGFVIPVYKKCNVSSSDIKLVKIFIKCTQFYLLKPVVTHSSYILSRLHSFLAWTVIIPNYFRSDYKSWILKILKHECVIQLG